MNSQVFPYLIPSIVCSCLALILLRYIWRQRSVPGALPLVVYLVAVFVRSTSSFFVIISESYEDLFYWSHISVLNSMVIPAAWVVLAMEFSQSEKGVSRRVLMLLLLEPVVATVLLLTNPWHGWVFGFEGVLQLGVLVLPDVKINWAMKLHVLYAMVLLFFGSFLLLKKIYRFHTIHRWQIVTLVIAIITPIVSNVWLVTHPGGVDYSPVAFSISCLALFLSIYRFGFLDIMPIARASVIEAMSDGMMVLDMQLKMIEVNSNAKTMLDFDRLDISSDGSNKILGSLVPNNISSGLSLTTNVMPRPEPLDVAALEIFGVEGKRYIEARYSPLNDSRGNLKAHLVIFRDITSRLEVEQQHKRYTEALEKTKEQLHEIDALKSHFFTNISHEFRTPLTLTLGALEDINNGRYGQLTEQGAVQVDSALRNSQRLLRLVGQLLDLSKVEAGGLELRARPVDVESFSRLLVGAFESLAASKDIKLVFSVDKSELELGGVHDEVFNAYVDPDYFEKILVNLLSNAFKFTPEGGMVAVSLSVSDQNTIDLMVEDDGSGIEEKELAHIFNRFYQVDSSSTRWHEGTGVGLSLVQELMNIHGGEVRVESQLGKGARFTLAFKKGAGHLTEGQVSSHEVFVSGERSSMIPDATKPESAGVNGGVLNDEGFGSLVAGKPEVGDGNENTSSEIVLLVEDNADMRAYIRQQIDPAYQLIEAVDGEEGLLLAKQFVPDLIISDVMMPKMDGHTLCAALKTESSTSHIPVILLTARTGEEEKISGLEAGADDYLSKPFNVRELQVRMNNLIENRKQLQDYYHRSLQASGAELVNGGSSEKVLLENRTDLSTINEQPLKVLPIREAEFVEKVTVAIAACLDQVDFKTKELASAIFMSERQLQRKLKAITGETPNMLIRRMRLEKAAALLEQGALSVTEISYAVGFSNSSYFSERFRDHYSVVPSEYSPSS